MTSIHDESKKVVWNYEKQLYNRVKLQNSPRQSDTMQPTRFLQQTSLIQTKQISLLLDSLSYFHLTHIFNRILDS